MGAGGSVLGTPLVPIGGLVVGALMGGLAGASTGGYLHCRRQERKEAEKAANFYINNHPDGSEVYFSSI